MSHNPFNLERRIALLDNQGTCLDYISQQEAGRYLRSSQAKLLLQYPPSIQLFKHYRPLLEKEKSHHHRPYAKSIIYGNYAVQNIDGKEIFNCDAIKILWYLNRGLVDIVSVEPPIVRLNFPANGEGHYQDQYYLSPKINRCVVCGTDKTLSRHHVVPYCFRKHMPDEIKSHSYHDVLLLCLDCHDSYERFADKLKWQLSIVHQVNINPKIQIDRKKAKASKFAHALLAHEEKIPPLRKYFLYQEIALYLNKNKDQVTQQDLEKIIQIDVYLKEESQYGQKVLSQWDLQDFVEMWRKHFVDSMNPQYMPEFWDTKRSIA